MELRDSDNIKNIEYKKLEKQVYLRAPQILGENWEKEYASLLICTSEKDAPENRVMIQESHNVGHALFFLSISLAGIVSGISFKNSTDKCFKTIGHLLCLREFILDDAAEKRKIVGTLLRALLDEKPDTNEKWLIFIHEHWKTIYSFAKAYGKEECFPDSSYAKLHDIVTCQFYFRSWWWQLKVKKVTRKSISMIRSLVKVG